jgi:hypothetical protein
MSSPDWLIIGVQRGPSEYLIYASTDLTSAELNSELQNYGDMYGDMGNSPYYQPTGMPPIYRHTLRAEMGSYVAVVAPSYAEAMQALFQQWKPEAKKRPELESQRAITGNH